MNLRMEQTQHQGFFLLCFGDDFPNASTSTGPSPNARLSLLRLIDLLGKPWSPLLSLLFKTDFDAWVVASIGPGCFTSDESWTACWLIVLQLGRSVEVCEAEVTPSKTAALAPGPGTKGQIGAYTFSLFDQWTEQNCNFLLPPPPRISHSS